MNEGSVPELAAAFRVAEYSGTLVTAAPSLTAAATLGEFDRVSTGIDADQRAFEEQLAVLELRDTDDERFKRIRGHADTLIFNIEAVKDDRFELFRLTERSQALRTELTEPEGPLGWHCDPGHRRPAVLYDDRLSRSRRSSHGPV